jgi:hypothetical protein
VVTIPRLTVAAERCQVLRRLLSAEDLLAADAARAVPGRRRLAAMVEHRNRHFSRLCRDIIRDVAAVHRASRLLRGRAHAGQAGASTGELLRIVAAGDTDAEAKLSEIKAQGDSVSVADLFEMQQLMNHFSQLSEMSSSIVAAGNSTISSIARNVK